MEPGQLFLNIILRASGVLVHESAPGWVGGGLVLALVLLSVTYFFRTRAQVVAANSFTSRLDDIADTEAFARQFEEFRASLDEYRSESTARAKICSAWDEFQETLVRDDLHGGLVLRNAIRPATFLNLEDLHFGPGFYRIMPGVFVSFGLLCTFLGLVAALHQLGDNLGSGAAPDVVVTGLMTIASAKFTMSLVGLACSILFGALLRWRQDRLGGALHKLCSSLEHRLVFVSLEDLGFRQLRAAEDQREYLRKIGMEMVAELSRPLGELPREITASITGAMEPIMNRVNQIGTSGMEGIVDDLSNQISHSVGGALSRASDALNDSAERLGSVIDRMNGSQAQMGDGMEAALAQMSSAIAELRCQVEATGQTASSTMNQGAERLLSVMNETLEGIRVNTGAGARAISEAAEEMRKAATQFHEEIEAATGDSAKAVRARMEEASQAADSAIAEAGRSVIDAFGRASTELAQLGDNMSSKLGSEILTKLEALAEQLDQTVRMTAEGTSGLRLAVTNLQAGTESMTAASAGLSTASRDMTTAVGPVRSSHERIEEKVSALARTVEATAETLTRASHSVAGDAARVLQTAGVALGTEREGIRQSLEAVRAALAQLSTEAGKLDQIDETLGRALVAYNTQLDAALDTAQHHIIQLRDTLAPGIDTLHSVVERAEQFIPASRRA